MKFALIIAALLGIMITPRPAFADDIPITTKTAKEYFFNGLRSQRLGNYSDALENYKLAYKITPSANKLMNIATMLDVLGRYAEAADACEQYLKAPDMERDREPEVRELLKNLELSLAERPLKKISIVVLNHDARVQVDNRYLFDRGLGSSARPLVVRLEFGEHEVSVVKDGKTDMQKVHVDESTRADTIVLYIPPPPQPSLSHRFQLGVFTRADLTVQNGGGVVGAFGLSFGGRERLELMFAGLIGREKGVEPGVSVSILTGAYKPIVSLAVPIFIGGGTWVGLKPALGFQWDAVPYFGLFSQVAVAAFITAPPGYEHIVFVPSIGAQGRLPGF